MSPAEINRELTVLKRMFSLAIQAGKLVHKPHFPMLRENNVCTGFFEREQYLSVLKYLPTSMQPVVRFAYVTGWRANSEVLPLQWRQVDLKAGEVRLNPGTTKNLERRVFYLTSELKELLKAQRKAADRIQRRKSCGSFTCDRAVAAAMVDCQEALVNRRPERCPSICLRPPCGAVGGNDRSS